MRLLRFTLKAPIGIMAAVVALSSGALAQDQGPVEPAVIPAEQFTKLFRLITPQRGELRFHEIPWLIDVWEARKKAVEEGKPILVWSGAGGSPVGVC